MTAAPGEGFRVHRGVFSPDELDLFRKEADEIAKNAGTACVRNLRKRSSLFANLARGPRLDNLLHAPLRPVRSILFDKTESQNWPVPWHQDLTIALAEKKETPGYGPWSVKDGTVHVQPPLELLESMWTIRIHLDDTPIENGALRVVPGSHRFGKVEAIRDSNLPASPVDCPCFAGDVLLMSPLIFHASRRAESPSHRRVLHFEYAPPSGLAAGLTWHEA